MLVQTNLILTKNYKKENEIQVKIQRFSNTIYNIVFFCPRLCDTVCDAVKNVQIITQNEINLK